ncbi:GAP family protein [uncultured Nocardioides sp.]|uniref:GAP family protein n=1 Tax=uncultured Nocardioides sp. TaxID=198441 RepID=UPI0025DDEA09|nr:GAP family protein [uncultured Nocardioides sp.]
MDAVAWLGLVGLALVDSTSMGTLVLPLVLLVAPRVHVGRYLVFLATVAGFYAAIGLALVAGADRLLELGRDLGDVQALRWAQLALGVTLLVVGVLGDPRRWWRRGTAGPAAVEQPRREDAWRARLMGQDASYRAVAGVGVLAALVEVASMVPFLAAVGIITAADLPAVGWVPVVLGYCLVMVLPALVLLGVRLGLDRQLHGRLERLAGWLDRRSSGAGLWVVAIVGLLLAGDAASALFP